MSQETCDVRGFVVCGGDNKTKLETYLLGEIIEAWNKSEIDIPGHVHTVAQTFQSSEEETKMEHRLSFVGPSGKLQLAETHLKRFLDHPGTAAQAEEFTVDWKKQMQNSDGPVWVATPSLENTHPVPRPASEPSLWQATLTYKTLQELQDDTFIAECSSWDSKIKFVVNGTLANMSQEVAVSGQRTQHGHLETCKHAHTHTHARACTHTERERGRETALTSSHARAITQPGLIPIG